MKKLLDRRMIGFILSVGAIGGLVAKINDSSTQMALIPIAIGAIVTLFGILVGGNVIDNKTTPKEPNVG